MKIGGLQAFSLSDFPGRRAAIIFTQGCNFHCPFCHNTFLLKEKDAVFSERKVLSFLQNRQAQLNGVVITGGEPTIHDDLLLFIKKIKNLGFAVKLDTNGSNPVILEDLLTSNLLDYIAMDIKAPFHLYNKLSGTQVILEDIKKSITIIENSKIGYEFRTTWVKKLLSSKNIEEIRDMISDSSCYKIQNFRQNNMSR